MSPYPEVELTRLVSAVALLSVAGCAAGGGPRPTVDLSAVTPAPETYGDGELSHLQYVLDEQQQEEFLALPMEERPEYLRIAWAALDPTPTTELNERKQDHYRRLAYARERFARDENPGWDKRGELLLRYGPPDVRQEIPGDVVPGLGLVPPREVWIYNWLGQAYQLEDARFQGNFQDALATRRTSRTDVVREVAGERDQDDATAPTANVAGASDIAALGADAETGPNFDTGSFRVLDAEKQMAAERLQTLLVRGQEGLEKRPRAYQHDYGGGKLDYFFDVQRFSDQGSGRTRLEINTAFWAKDLKFMREGADQVAVLETEVALKTPDFREVGHTAKRTRDRRDSIRNLQGSLVLDQISLVTDPGDYRLALSVRDSLSGNSGIFQTETSVPDFGPGQFAISDIQLALAVSRGEPGGLFTKGNLQVVPYPLGTFPRDRDIFLYFEIYGLKLSRTGDALYTVEFKIQPRTETTASWFGSSKGQVVPGVATAYDGTSTSSNVQEYFSLDPTTFTEDVYDVRITVHDRVSERQVERATTFAVQP